MVRIPQQPEPLTDHDRLARDWRETFGESMPFGFEIQAHDLPVLREWVEQASQAPLNRLLGERLRNPAVAY